MAIFAKGVPRLPVLLLSAAILIAIPPEVLARGPDLCLWRTLFHVAACPACGSTRALAALFHGRPSQAFAFNHNVVVTAPMFIFLLLQDLIAFVRMRLKGLNATA